MKQFLWIVLAAMMLAEMSEGQDTPARTVDDPAASKPTAPASGGNGGYGRAEIFVVGFGLFTGTDSGNSINHDATETAGFSAGYRFHLNSRSALEGRYGFARNSQKYDIGGAVSSIPNYQAEVTGSYIYNLPRVRRFLPFLEAGGGFVHFSPGQYGNSATGGMYPFDQMAAPVVTGSTAGVSSQTKPTLVYGGGVDYAASSHISVRVDYRGLAYKAPDFGQKILQTNAFGMVSEPSFGIAYRF